MNASARTNPQDHADRPNRSPRRSRRRTGGLSLVVGIVATVILGIGLEAEPHFVDESAFISQSYFADLYLAGERDRVEWLTYPAVDLPPLPKYLIGLTFRVVGIPRPGPEAARAWYGDTSRRFVDPAALVRARLPSLVLGAIGCMAVFGLGTITGGRRVGALAAAAILLNPLYRLHARRAMADIPAESLLTLAELVGLWAWCRLLAGRRGPATWAAVVGCGIAAGLAVEAKLNGGLGLIVVGAWALLGLLLPGRTWGRVASLIGGFALASAVAFATFAALNPTLTARPVGPLPPGVKELAGRSLLGRVGAIVDHRATVSQAAKEQFPHNALPTLAEKCRAVAVQGFGRFGPLGPSHSDSTRRYDPDQDWGVALWAPLVALGMLMALGRGRHQNRRGEPPTGYALALLWLVSLAVVTAFIPLAWDRYFLSIQVGNALLGAFGIVSTIDLLRGRGVGGGSLQ